MWYVLYCPKSNEEAILQSCRQKISGRALKDIFVFTYERMKRYQGSWHLENEKLFPDYIFLESDSSEELSRELEQYRDIVQVMEEKEALLPVTEGEERLLRELCGKYHHLPMSKGVIRGGTTLIMEGPLKGKEQMIGRIDRHKRIAFLKTSVFSGRGSVRVGLEIMEKNSPYPVANIHTNDAVSR